MNKSLSIALGVVVAMTIVAPAAAADPPMTAQERGEPLAFQAGQQGSGQQIIAQERGRQRDTRVVSGNPNAAALRAIELRSQELGKLCQSATLSRELYIGHCGPITQAGNPSAVPPVQIVGSAPADTFDFEDATIGGAAVGALALLVGGGLVFGRTRTRRAASATS